MWNSRKGAAFGFHMIAAKAGEQLAPFLPQLVPRLYRYQFDPNLSIRQAMTSIWDALVTDKTLVDKYLKEILQDVISNLTSNTWRVRESSCLALNDLVRGRQADDLIDHLAEIWETLFRVLDDIKESVRKAADLALKTLSKVCTRMCESTGSAAQRTVAVVLPTLLEKGVLSNVAEVRSLSIQTLVKISKTAGPRLKPHAPRLIPALLEALSTLEPQVLNYLSLRATEQEKVACFQQELCSLMCEKLKLSTWKVQLAALQCMEAFFQRLLLLDKGSEDVGALSQIFTDACWALTFPLENKSYSSVRTEALAVVDVLVKRTAESEQWECMASRSREQLQLSLATLQSDSRAELRERAQELRRRIQSQP
eukprot:XP_011619911.1 PREDICTED: proteasome-associated protein ECM29 homolog [Takifugu rubripes]